MYAYQQAEAVLDRFAADPKRSNLFRRNYLLFKLSIHANAIACTDPKLDYEERLAASWEDVCVTFSGRGHSALTGGVLGLWSELPPSEDKTFRDTIIDAFRKAEEHTPAGHEFRYEAKDRRKKPLGPNSTWSSSPLVPAGPSLDGWILDYSARHGFDPDVVRDLLSEHNRPAQSPEKRGGHLRLV